MSKSLIVTGLVLALNAYAVSPPAQNATPSPVQEKKQELRKQIKQTRAKLKEQRQEMKQLKEESKADASKAATEVTPPVTQ